MYFSIATKLKDVTFRGTMTMKQLVKLNWKSIWTESFLEIISKELKTKEKPNVKKNEDVKKNWYDTLQNIDGNL